MNILKGMREVMRPVMKEMEVGVTGQHVTLLRNSACREPYVWLAMKMRPLDSLTIRKDDRAALVDARGKEVSAVNMSLEGLRHIKAQIEEMEAIFMRERDELDRLGR